WIMGTNPAVSLPDSHAVCQALAACPLVMVSEVMQETDTSRFAHIRFPALGWGEKNGTVTNSERRISRQRAFLPAPGEARPDWWIIARIAEQLGYGDAFAWEHPQEIFCEHAALTAFENNGERALNLRELASLSREAWDALAPYQWHAGDFPQRNLVPVDPSSHGAGVDELYPLILNTGRIRDQWHTMTRTGKSPRLGSHVPEPFIDLHPHDALLCGVGEGELARVSSRWGAMVGRVTHSGGIARGGVFVPIHWSGPTASDARVGALVNPVVDPVSGEPEFKHTPVKVEPFVVEWQAFVLSRTAPQLDALTWWTRVQGEGFLRYEAGGRGKVGGEWARALLGVDDDADWIEYEDRSAGVYRAAHLVDGRLQACVLVAKAGALPPRDWLGGLFAQEVLGAGERAVLLAGRPVQAGADAGPTVCSCFGVGRNTICAAIREKGLRTAGEVTACLKAGGNCGSCLPEIGKLLAVPS
ncbi:MAG TPA: nitrate reductase, partial [Massilia sp.]|nr:nitrate reductase [Massilia sp.]